MKSFSSYIQGSLLQINTVNMEDRDRASEFIGIGVCVVPICSVALGHTPLFTVTKTEHLKRAIVSYHPCLFSIFEFQYLGNYISKPLLSRVGLHGNRRPTVGQGTRAPGAEFMGWAEGCKEVPYHSKRRMISTCPSSFGTIPL